MARPRRLAGTPALSFEDRDRWANRASLGQPKIGSTVLRINFDSPRARGVHRQNLSERDLLEQTARVSAKQPQPSAVHLKIEAEAEGDLAPVVLQRCRRMREGKG